MGIPLLHYSVILVMSRGCLSVVFHDVSLPGCFLFGQGVDAFFLGGRIVSDLGRPSGANVSLRVAAEVLHGVRSYRVGPESWAASLRKSTKGARRERKSGTPGLLPKIWSSRNGSPPVD